MHASRALVSAHTQNLSCTRPFPNAAFIHYIWPCLSDWDDICGTKWRLKCPRIFFPEWKKRGRGGGVEYNKNAHHSMFALYWRLFLITTIVSRSVFCWPYCLLASSGGVLSSSKSLLSQDKCRWSSSLAVSSDTRTPEINRTESCSSVDYRSKFLYFMADIARTRASSELGFEIRYYYR